MQLKEIYIKNLNERVNLLSDKFIKGLATRSEEIELGELRHKIELYLNGTTSLDDSKESLKNV